MNVAHDSANGPGPTIRSVCPRALGLTLAAFTLGPVVGAQTTQPVTASGTSFSPPTVYIQMGDTVEWTWGTGTHNVVSGKPSGPTPDGLFSSGAPAMGPSSFSFTFDADFLAASECAAVYEYYCDVHVSSGMIGRVAVVDAPLTVDNPQISLGAGGGQTMLINAGPGNAGQLYWVLGTTAGFSPGFGGLPLNFSNYLLFTISSPNTLITNQLFFLDAFGTNSASLTSFSLPPGLDPALAGVVFHHAAVVLDTGGTTLLVSNACPLTLVP